MITTSTRFLWRKADKRGFASYGWVEAGFVRDELPKLEGFPQPLTEIDYWGVGGLYRVRADRAEEMTGTQQRVILSLLQRMAAAARAVLGLDEDTSE